MTLVNLLVVLVIGLVVVWATREIMRVFQVPDPMRTILYVLVVLIVVIWVLSSLSLTVPSVLR